MRVNVRQFTREYKSRSFKTTPKSCGRTSDTEIATRRIDELQKEAEAIFRRDEVVRSTSRLDGDLQNETMLSGRILPCLLSTSVDTKDKNVGGAYRGNRRSTTKRLEPKLKKSRETHSDVGVKLTQSTSWSPSMSDEFVALSDLELRSLVERAKTELVHRKEAGKVQLRAEIEAKLKDAGLALGDLFESERESTRGNDGQNSVAAKYKKSRFGRDVVRSWPFTQMGGGNIAGA
jgi:hypothetical protein